MATTRCVSSGSWTSDLQKGSGTSTEKKCQSFKMNKARCKCGWEVGQNLSGDCGDCNAAIATLSKSKRRSREHDSGDVHAVRFEVPSAKAAEAEDVLQTMYSKRTIISK